MNSQMVLVKKMMESITTLYDGLQIYLQELNVQYEDRREQNRTETTMCQKREVIKDEQEK